MANHVTDVEDASFEEVVIKSDIPVIVDFWATWCGPCKAMAPHLESVAEEFSGKVKVVKINTENNKAVAQKHGINSLPTLLCFKNGEPLPERVIGGQSANNLRSLFKSLI